MTSRRDFLKSSAGAGLLGLGGLGLLSTAAGCSTFDDFIFDDHDFSSDHVIIVGGGISGLATAYHLRQVKSRYRLFEGSAVIGGRIRSEEGLDFGASVFDTNHVLVKKFVKEFNLSEVALSKEQFYLANGAVTLVKGLVERVAGLMPYRNVRLKWRLFEIRKSDAKYELLFDTPQGRRVVRAEKVALTLPPSQWARVTGLLELPEMAEAKAWLMTCVPETIFKLHYTMPANQAGNWNRKMKVVTSEDGHTLSALAKTQKGNMLGFEFELLQRQSFDQDTLQLQSDIPIEMEKYISLINTRTKLGLQAKRTQPESFFSWSDVDLIQSAYFRNSQLFQIKPDSQFPNFQIFGDYSSSSHPHTVEGALQEAKRVAALFI